MLLLENFYYNYKTIGYRKSFTLDIIQKDINGFVYLRNDGSFIWGFDMGIEVIEVL